MGTKSFCKDISLRKVQTTSRKAFLRRFFAKKKSWQKVFTKLSSQKPLVSTLTKIVDFWRILKNLIIRYKTFLFVLTPTHPFILCQISSIFYFFVLLHFNSRSCPINFFLLSSFYCLVILGIFIIQDWLIPSKKWVWFFGSVWLFFLKIQEL